MNYLGLLKNFDEGVLYCGRLSLGSVMVLLMVMGLSVGVTDSFGQTLEKEVERGFRDVGGVGEEGNEQAEGDELREVFLERSEEWEHEEFIRERLDFYGRGKGRVMRGKTFRLEELSFGESYYLSEDIFVAFEKVFVGREMDIKDVEVLFLIVNDMYGRLGVLTGRAELRVQESKLGRLHVSLFEPKLGKIRLERLGGTDEDFVRSRLTLEEGVYPDFRKISEELYRFSKWYGKRLRARFESGSDSEEVDIVIEGEEVKDVVFVLTASDRGEVSTGRLRSNIIFRHEDMNGRRDEMSWGFNHSDSRVSYEFGYTTPFFDTDGKMSWNYTHSSFVNKKALDNISLETKSHTVNMKYVYPLLIRREYDVSVELGVGMNYLSSIISGVLYSDLENRTVSMGVNADVDFSGEIVRWQVKYVNGHSHSRIEKKDRSFNYIEGGLSWDRLWREYIVGVKFHSRFMLERDVPSHLQYTLGGLSSVRGYSENFVSGTTGVFGQLKLSLLEPFRFSALSFSEGEGEVREYGLSFIPSIFTDYGFLTPFVDTVDGGVGFGDLWGAGLSLDVTGGETGVRGNVTIAHPLYQSFKADVSDLSTRVNMSISFIF